MKAIMILSLMIMSFVSGLFADETAKPDLNKQIAALEAKASALEAENAKLKAEIEKKNQAIQALAMQLANRAAQNRTAGSSGKNNYADAQKEQRARQLAAINRQIADYESQKADLRKEYQAGEKKLVYAKRTIDRNERKKAVKQAEEDQKRIQSKIAEIENKISGLRSQSIACQ